MTDPGSVVGTISLALQVLKGLKWYYSQFRSYHDDIEAIATRTESIEQILLVIQQPISKLWRDDDELSIEVQKCVAACRQATVRLQEYQHKCEQPDHVPNMIKKRLVLVKQRAFYPFRKDTLQDMQSILEKLLSNLTIVIQCLDLDSSSRIHDQLLSTSGSIIQSVDVVHQRQIYQTELLEVIDEKIGKQMVQTTLQEPCIQSQRLNHSAQLASVERKVDDLTQAVKEMILHNRTSIPTPGELSVACDQYVSTLKSTERTIQLNAWSNRPIVANSQRYDALFSCTCSRYPRQRVMKKPTRFLSGFWHSRPHHTPLCPFHNPTQRVQELGFRLRACRSALGYLVETTFQWSSGLVSMQVKSRNIVAENTRPAFVLCDTFEHYYYYVPRDWASKAYDKFIRAMSVLLKDGKIGIRDELPNGNNLAHNLFKCVGKYIGEGFVSKEAKLITAVSFLRNNSFEVNHVNNWLMTPLDSMVRVLRFRSDANLFDNNIDGLAYSCFQGRSSPTYMGFYEKITSMDPLGYSCEDGSISHSIVRRSESSLSAALATQDMDNRLRNGYSYLDLSVRWPRGLHMLLEHDSRSRLFNLEERRNALLSAIRSRNFESVAALIHDPLAVTSKHWGDALFYKNEDVIKLILKALRNAITKLSCGSAGSQAFVDCELVFHQYFLEPHYCQLLIDNNFPGWDTNANDRWGKPLGTPLVWHSSVESSEYQDFHLPMIAFLIEHGACLYSVEPHCGTFALHLVSKRLVVYCFGKIALKYGISEAIDMCDMNGEMDFPSTKDCRIKISPLLMSADNTYETHESTNGRVIGHNGYAEIIQQVAKGYPALISILTDLRRDDCSCSCAVGGCSIISSIMKAPTAWISSFSASTLKQAQRIAFQILLSLCPETLSQAGAFSAVLRAMTFDALCLTHTCHNDGFCLSLSRDQFCLNCCPQNPVGYEEYADIQYIESDSLGLLESLLKDFDCVWKSYDGTMLDFLDGYWSTRMHEVIEKEMEKANGSLKHDDSGLVISTFEPEPEPELERRLLSDDEIWDCFESEVDSIVTGKYTLEEIIDMRPETVFVDGTFALGHRLVLRRNLHDTQLVRGI